MKHVWLYPSKSDIETERLQCTQEGRDLSLVQYEFNRILAHDLENSANWPAAYALLDKTITLPIRSDFKFHEPSDLEGIRAARPVPVQIPTLSLASAELEDRVYGAWAGRTIGCLLGKPVEGWRRPKMWGYLKETNRWPLNDFFKIDILSQEQKDKWNLNSEWHSAWFGDRAKAMPEDDDMNYTTTGLAIMKKHGASFTPTDVANFWMNEIPINHTCTAERIAYKNFALLIGPPESASYRNPYREWIGAQIRADFWGYAAPGNPELAAEFAWRDASISHVKNGIYGEMWVAAMIAAAFVTSDIQTIIRAGLAQIPANCRLSDAIESVLEWHEVEVDYDTAVYRLHELWNEDRPHDWCHTISNAMIVVIALLWGENDYATTICRAVQPCFDTDCNGATSGSILGAIIGRKSLPSNWMDVINDTLHTGVAGYNTVRIADLTRDTMKVIEKTA